MKKRNNILISIMLLFGLLGMTSCLNDLNVTPIDPLTQQQFNADSVFVKIYANLALTGQKGPDGSGDLSNIDEGTSSFIRLIWNLNELSTDEAMCSWGDPGVPELNFNKWSSSHDMVEGLYSRFYFGITMCNLFLSETAGATDDKLVKQRAEVRFMRALNYYYLMDMFGNVPFTEVVSTDPPKQIKRADLFAWLETELKTAETDMYAAKQAPYYRADKVAADMLLARMYLNAEIYTGTTKWNEAAEYAYKAIQSGYTLCPTYKQLFMADNAGAIDNSSVNKARNEIVFSIACHGVYTRSWGNSLYMIASTHASGMPAWGTTEGWGGNRARATLAKKFFPSGVTNDDIAAQFGKTKDGKADSLIGTVLRDKAGDDRALFWGWKTTDSKGVDPISISAYTVYKQGLAVSKWSNSRADGGVVSDPKYVDTDMPLFRLAEAYLTYAEAVLRGGTAQGGLTAFAAVNTLQTRAHVVAPKITNGNISLPLLADEWAREFYFEGRRRMDLIRFGYFGGSTSYTWDWKGGTAAGTNFSSNYNLFPIPSSDLSVNPNLVQNPGY